MRIAKDQKEKYDKEMAEKMENARKAQAEKEAAEAAAQAQAQAAKKAAEEAKAIAKAAAKTTAKSKRSADEKTGATQKSKKKDGRKEEGAAAHGGAAAVAANAGSATGLDTAGRSEKGVSKTALSSGTKAAAIAPSDTGGGELGVAKSKVGAAVDGATGDNQDFIVENHSYEDSDIENKGQEGAKEDSSVPDTEKGKKFKDCESCHYRLKQFTFYSFKIYELKHIEIKQ